MVSLASPAAPMNSGKQAAAMASTLPRLLFQSFLMRDFIESVPNLSLRIGCRCTGDTVSEVFKQMVKLCERFADDPVWDSRLARLCIALIIQWKPLARLGRGVHFALGAE